MGPRSAKARVRGSGEAPAQVGSLRMAMLLTSALVVVAGMLLLSDRAHEQADRARRAQVLMERVRSETQDVDVVTWRGLATDTAGSQATARAGLSAYRRVVSTLRQLGHLGVAQHEASAIERDVGSAYGYSLNAMVIAKQDARAGRQIALTSFRPAMRRLTVATDGAILRQDNFASDALLRARLGSLASLAIGVLLLALLGWRFTRIRSRVAMSEQAREAERRSEERLRALMRHSSDVVAVIEPSSHLRWLAESVRGMLGHEPDAMIGRPLGDLVHPDDTKLVESFLRDAATKEGAALSLRMRAAGGTYRDIEIVADDRSGDPLIEGVLVNMRDVTERRELLERLRHQAFHDSLTGLPNRALFEDRLGQALVRLRRRPGAAAVMFIDLDDFKTVNDGLGHAAGDELLQEIARRLEGALRAQDTGARLGGDEFAVLLDELADDDEALTIAERVRSALEQPLVLDGRQIAPTVSIGVACRAVADTADDLLGNADVAMYAAKARGKAQIAPFQAQMRELAVERAELTAELATALQRGEFVLDYQPLVWLKTGEITGFEALIRWEHPTRGRLSPDRFISLAESAGVIVPIGAWVLRTACAQLRRWQDTHGGPQRGVSVNVSAHQLADGGLADTVRDALRDAGVCAHQLTLEITEGLLVEDRELIQSQMRELKELGVRFAVDDFGTGYSALSYLRSFPLDVLKIDRSFVTGIDTDSERAHLVRGIIDMAHSIALVVVTEGIEELPEAELVRELRSDYGQGYWFSRPVDPAAIDVLLSSESAEVERAA